MAETLSQTQKCAKISDAPALLSTAEGVAHRASGGVEQNTLNPATIQNGDASLGEVDVDEYVQGNLSFADVVELELAQEDEAPTYRTFEAFRSALKGLRGTPEGETLNGYYRRTARRLNTKPVDIYIDSHIDLLARRYAFDMNKNRSRIDTVKFREAIFERSLGHCETCSAWCSEIMHLHHVWPVAKGGASILGNLIGLCPNCHAFAHRLREAKTESEAEKLLCYQLRDAVGIERATLVIRVAHAEAVWDGLKWRTVKDEDEYLDAAWLALRDALCISRPQFDLRFRRPE